jgi:opacity protein-like surface antigen
MKSALLVLALAAALPQAAQAEDLSYSYIEGGYAISDFDNSILGSFDDFYLSGSYNFGDSGFFAAGSYKPSSGDIGGASGFEIDTTSLGLGYHYDISENVHFVGQLDYIDTSVNFGSNIDGYRVSTGFRGSFSDKFEGAAMAHYENYSDIDASDASLSLEGQFKFNETLGLVAGVEFGQRFNTDVLAYNVGLRASF